MVKKKKLSHETNWGDTVNIWNVQSPKAASKTSDPAIRETHLPKTLARKKVHK